MIGNGKDLISRRRRSYVIENWEIEDKEVDGSVAHCFYFAFFKITEHFFINVVGFESVSRVKTLLGTIVKNLFKNAFPVLLDKHNAASFLHNKLPKVSIIIALLEHHLNLGPQFGFHSEA